MAFELISFGLDVSGLIAIWLFGNYLLWETIGKRINISIERRPPKSIIIYGENK